MKRRGTTEYVKLPSLSVPHHNRHRNIVPTELFITCCQSIKHHPLTHSRGRPGRTESSECATANCKYTFAVRSSLSYYHFRMFKFFFYK